MKVKKDKAPLISKIRFEFVSGKHVDIDRYDYEGRTERDIYAEIEDKVENKPNGAMWWGNINLINVTHFYIVEAEKQETDIIKSKLVPKKGKKIK